MNVCFSFKRFSHVLLHASMYVCHMCFSCVLLMYSSHVCFSYLFCACLFLIFLFLAFVSHIICFSYILLMYLSHVCFSYLFLLYSSRVCISSLLLIFVSHICCDLLLIYASHIYVYAPHVFFLICFSCIITSYISHVRFSVSCMLCTYAVYVGFSCMCPMFYVSVLICVYRVCCIYVSSISDAFVLCSMSIFHTFYVSYARCPERTGLSRRSQSTRKRCYS